MLANIQTRSGKQYTAGYNYADPKYPVPFYHHQAQVTRIVRRPELSMLWIWRHWPLVSSLLQQTQKREDNVQIIIISIREHYSTHQPNKRGTPEVHVRTSMTHRIGESYCTNDNRYWRDRPREWSVAFRIGEKQRGCNQKAAPWNNRTREHSVARGHGTQRACTEARQPAWSR